VREDFRCSKTFRYISLTAQTYEKPTFTVREVVLRAHKGCYSVSPVIASKETYDESFQVFQLMVSGAKSRISERSHIFFVLCP